eukprot:scaffold57667_cov58-Phaeocystis_antarctica.AAC.2
MLAVGCWPPSDRAGHQWPAWWFGGLRAAQRGDAPQAGHPAVAPCKPQACPMGGGHAATCGAELRGS